MGEPGAAQPCPVLGKWPCGYRTFSLSQFTVSLAVSSYLGSRRFCLLSPQGRCPEHMWLWDVAQMMAGPGEESLGSLSPQIWLEPHVEQRAVCSGWGGGASEPPLSLTAAGEPSRAHCPPGYPSVWKDSKCPPHCLAPPTGRNLGAQAQLSQDPQPSSLGSPRRHNLPTVMYSRGPPHSPAPELI